MAIATKVVTEEEIENHMGDSHDIDDVDVRTLDYARLVEWHRQLHDEALDKNR